MKHDCKFIFTSDQFCKLISSCIVVLVIHGTCQVEHRYVFFVAFPTGSAITTTPHEAKPGNRWNQKWVSVQLLYAQTAREYSPAANTIWATVPIDVGPPRRIVLRACMYTYTPAANSPPPDTSRQLQQLPNSCCLVTSDATGVSCSVDGGALDMIKLKCVRYYPIVKKKSKLSCNSLCKYTVTTSATLYFPENLVPL